MILIDAIYINNSGGLVLLRYLIEVIQQKNLEVFYLLDNRTEDCFGNICKNKVKFIKNSHFERMKFYSNNKDKFDSILCFGNVPPPLRLKAKVFVYFHQKLFLEIPNEFNLKGKLVYKIKQFYLNFYKNNCDKWLVQSKLMQKQFALKYLNKDLSNIQVLPFYPPLNMDIVKPLRNKSSFIYVSNSGPHKNHENLIHAFCEAYDITKLGSLTLTVPKNDVVLNNLISEKVELGYPILNVGFIDREQLSQLYLSSEYLIFPSLSESFGLGLVEGIDAGCKVIVSDLPYAYEVCKPSLTFNPYTKESIKIAIIQAMNEKLTNSEKTISNDIDRLILLLSDNI
ncbi:glycosyltransferase [Acinetobacter baumannii]|nr:glycosyltransferase [Acinetobacter baumannii]